ncbi:uncharacterized protein LOC136095354 isoform X1 [Hydra vulgaris]|uniref:uncharacterized protein LOC136095354 isoform X1 n=1 Tax=Hydra vulgaris TaxID=6087 RepID=UPI0032EA20CE
MADKTDRDIISSKDDCIKVMEKGISVTTCALFIVATMAGSGILAIPKALSESGWTGIVLLILGCCMSLYCGIILGQCWMLTNRTLESSRQHIRDPYPTIGKIAAGKLGKRIVEICVLVTLVGVCTVFLLLSANQISSIVSKNIGSLKPQNEFRVFVLICGLVLLPFTWLNSPKEIWQFALAASLCTIIACIFIIIRTSMYLYENGVASNDKRTTETFKSFFSAFGTIAFAFGGAIDFPSLQTDMKLPDKFPLAAILAFIAVLFMYIPVAVLPYLAFGSTVDGNILKTLKNLERNGKFMITMSEVVITLHLLFTFVITINPISRQLETYFKTEHNFGRTRVILRSSIVFFIIGISEAVPHFGVILSIVGGTTVTMTSFILPCYFYWILKKNIPLYVKILLLKIVLIAVISGGSSTYTACTQLTNPFVS